MLDWLMDRLDPQLRLERWWRYSVLRKPRPAYWRHSSDWECTTPPLGPHIHYGKNVVLPDDGSRFVQITRPDTPLPTRRVALRKMTEAAEAQGLYDQPEAELNAT